MYQTRTVLLEGNTNDMKDAYEQGVANVQGLRRQPVVSKGFCNIVWSIMWKYRITEQWKPIPGDEDNIAVWRWWDGIEGKEGIKKRVEEKQIEGWRERLLHTKKGPY